MLGPDNGLDAQVMHGLPCMAGLWPVGHNGQFGRDRACNGRVGIMREYGMVEKVGSGDMTKRGLANWACPLPILSMIYCLKANEDMDSMNHSLIFLFWLLPQHVEPMMIRYT